MHHVGALVIAYLIGSIPFGYIVARLVKGIDIREHGSKNIGATNVARVCGRGWGILVFVLDFLKGAGPVLLAEYAVIVDYNPPEAVHVLSRVTAGAGSVAGHMLPVFLGFRGGKGVATTGGVFAVLAPQATAIAVGTWVLVTAISRYVSLGSICSAFALGMSNLFLNPRAALHERLPITIFSLVMMILVIARHAGNIQRLVAGMEPRIGEKKREAEAAPPEGGPIPPPSQGGAGAGGNVT